MTWQAWVMLAVLGLVLAELARNKRPPDIILLGATVFTALLGIVTPEQAFSGFANTGMLTVAALFLVAAALRETGALDTIGAWFLGKARTEGAVLVRLSLTVTAMSAFLNNTPIVAMFIPIIGGWCKKHQVSVSRLLLPLSYLTILGGTCTLIGTSTNLVVDGLMKDAVRRSPELGQSLAPMTIFEMSPVGVPYAVAGALYLLLAGRHLLPRRKGILEQVEERSREYLVNLRVEPGCRLARMRVDEAGLRHLPGLFLVEITRGHETIAPVTPEQVLQVDDILTFTGVVSTIVDLERVPGLVPVADEGYEREAAKRRDRMLCEAVISPTSPLIGKSIRTAEFRATYNAAVIAVHRGGERLGGRVGDIVLRQGDTLLLQTGPHFGRAHRNNPDFHLVSSVEDSRPLREDKAAVSLLLLVVLVGLMAFDVFDIVLSAFLIAGLMVACRCIAPNVARQSIDWQTLVTIGAAFGLGKALERSGLVAVVAGHVVDLTGAYGPVAVMAGLYVFTSIVTELITNNAAAALMFPFALAMAAQMGVSPRPFVMATMFAASASFLTPIGYQTNLMVYGPGGYRFTDFLRVGLPLNLLLLVVATLLIPRTWPF